MPHSEFPSLRQHKPTNRAVVTVRRANGERLDLYCGEYKSRAAKAEYSRIIGILAANGGRYPSDAADVTMAEALLRYTRHINEQTLSARRQANRNGD